MPAPTSWLSPWKAYGTGGEADIEDGTVPPCPAPWPSSASVFAACGILLAGLPPLSGFISKFAMLSAMMGTGSIGTTPDPAVWALIVLVILSGLAALISMTRNGIRTFWGSIEGAVPRVLVVELTP